MEDERQGKKPADAKDRSRDIEPADSLNLAGSKDENQKNLSSEGRMEGERQEKKPAADRQDENRGKINSAGLTGEDKREPSAAVKDEYQKQSASADTDHEHLKPRLEVISQIRQVRREQHITQETLAVRAGTKKSNISRLESGKYNPSLDLLVRVAGCLGKRIHIWME